MIKVIALDLGGVLFLDGTKELLEQLEHEQGLDAEQIRSILKSEQTSLLRKGMLTDQQYWEWAQQQLPAGYRAEDLKRDWFESYKLDEGVSRLVQKLRDAPERTYKLVIFSGNTPDRVAYLDERYSFRRWFDDAVYSFEEGHEKPEPEFVQALIRRTRVQPQEIFYVDDKESFVKPAVERGIHVHIYKTGEVKALEDAIRNAGVTF